jgi:hypothetical protein
MASYMRTLHVIWEPRTDDTIDYTTWHCPYVEGIHSMAVHLTCQYHSEGNTSLNAREKSRTVTCSVFGPSMTTRGPQVAIADVSLARCWNGSQRMGAVRVPRVHSSQPEDE